MDAMHEFYREGVMHSAADKLPSADARVAAGVLPEAAATSGAQVPLEAQLARLQRELAEETERRVLAERELAQEQTKRVRAESELQWLLHELQALSDRLAAEMSGLARANWRATSATIATDSNAAPAT